MKQLSDAVNATPENLMLDLQTKSGWRRALNWALGLVVFTWVAVLMAWSALHIFIVPRISDYREVLQQQASRALGIRVEIGHVSAQGGWLVPWFEANDIVLFDREGRDALRLPRVIAAVSPLSVLFGQFEQLDIEQPELEIRRDAQGHVWVAGLDTSAAGDGRGADWFFSQPAFMVRQGAVHWRDESRPAKAQTSAPVLSLQGLDVSVKNQWFQHELRVDATPPEAFGQRLSVRGKFSNCLGSARAIPRNGRVSCLPTCLMSILRPCANGWRWTKVCLCKKAVVPCVCGPMCKKDNPSV